MAVPLGAVCGSVLEDPTEDRLDPSTNYRFSLLAGLVNDHSKVARTDYSTSE